MEIKSPLFEKLCSIIEEVVPDFDRTDVKDIDTLTKCFVLSTYDTKPWEKLKKLYLDCICEEQNNRLDKMIKETGFGIVKYELRKLSFEKEIIEKRIEITKKLMN